jgi:hypothetical protein
MSWGRFIVVAILTALLLLPLSALAAPLVRDIEEPMRTIVIVVAFVAIYFVIDRSFIWLLHRLDRSRRPDRPVDPD